MFKKHLKNSLNTDAEDEVNTQTQTHIWTANKQKAEVYCVHVANKTTAPDFFSNFFPRVCSYFLVRL